MCDICRPAGQRAWYGERSDVGVGCVSSATSIRPADEKLTRCRFGSIQVRSRPDYLIATPAYDFREPQEAEILMLRPRQRRFNS
jgi:hypothetical protein